MKRHSVYAITLFAFAVMQIGFFAVGDIASADLELRRPGRIGGITPPTIRTSVTNTTSTNDCGIQMTGTTTTTERYYSGRGWLVIRVVSDTQTTFPIGDVHDTHTDTPYARLADGTLTDVITEGTTTVTPFEGSAQNVRFVQHYVIFPGEVVKPSLLQKQTKSFNALVGILTTINEQVTSSYDAAGTLLSVSGAIEGGDVSSSDGESADPDPAYENRYAANDVYAVSGDDARIESRTLTGELKNSVYEDYTKYRQTLDWHYDDATGNLMGMSGTGPVSVGQNVAFDSGLPPSLVHLGIASPTYTMIGCFPYISRTSDRSDMIDYVGQTITACDMVTELEYDAVGHLTGGTQLTTCTVTGFGGTVLSTTTTTVPVTEAPKADGIGLLRPGMSLGIPCENCQ